MKVFIFIVFWFAWGMAITPYALADCSDEYLQSEQYQTIKQANESLRKIKAGEL